MVLIIDTDPGVDDMLAMLLLLAQCKEKQELALISLTFGNTSLKSALRNALSLFHVIDLENEFRKGAGLPKFTNQKPKIAIGSRAPVSALKDEDPVDAEDVHGNDGLGGIHTVCPQWTAPDKWMSYFGPDAVETTEELPFIVGKKPAWIEILDILKAEPADTVRIVAIGPLSNIARAAEHDPETFSRVSEVVSMGATLEHVGNVTPVAEFNVFADPIAAARVYALTSSKPHEMLPPNSPESLKAPLPKPLNLLLAPLDTTTSHSVGETTIEEVVGTILAKYPQAPMPQWTKKWMDLSLRNYGRLFGKELHDMELHDPLTAAYVSTDPDRWLKDTRDVRVETSGQWTSGMTVIDRRDRVRLEHNPQDFLKWLTLGSGNNVNVLRSSPWPTTFGEKLFCNFFRSYSVFTDEQVTL